MTIDYNQNFLIKASPHLDLKDENGYLKVTNIKTKEWFIFKDKSVIDLLEYLKRPKAYQELTYNENIEIENRNKEALDNLIDWRLVNIELELTERDCPLCGAKENEEVVKKFNESFNHFFSYCKCKKCQTIFLNPCPSERAIDCLYSKFGYYSRTTLKTDGVLQKRIIKRSNKIRTSIIQNNLKLDAQKNILDIGCSTGEFLDYLYNEHKCKVYGLDIDKHGLQELNNKNSQVKTYFGKIEDFLDNTINYEVITAWGVIEHLHSPLKLLELSKNLLNENGLLIFDLPNVCGKIAKWDLRNWPYLNPPFHITHLNEKRFIKKAEEMGYLLIDISYQRTGSFLLKYSDLLLYIINTLNMTYTNRYLDYFITIISQPLLWLEKKLKFNSRLTITLKTL